MAVTPTIIGTYTNTALGVSSIDLHNHSFTQVGDITLVVVGQDSTDASVTFSIQNSYPDWQQLHSVGSADQDVHQAVFWRRATVSGQWAFNVNSTDSADMWGTCITIRGVREVNPFHPTVLEKSGVSNAIILSSSDVPEDNALLFAAWSTDGGDMYPFSHSEVYFTPHIAVQASTSGNVVAGGVSICELGPSRSIPNFYVYFNASDGAVGCTFSLIPEQSAPSQDQEATTYSSTQAFGSAEEVATPSLSKEAPTYSQPASFGAALEAITYGQEAAAYSHAISLGEAAFVIKMATAAASITSNHSVGIHEDGTVFAKGYNWSGSVDSVNGLTNKLHAAALNYATVIQNADKTLTGYGQTTAFGSQAILDGWGTPDIKQMTGGQDWFAILLDDGTVKATNVGMTTSAWADVVSICGGDYHLLALTADGTVYSAVSDGQTIGGDVVSCVAGWSDIERLDTSDEITFGLKTDGTFVQNTSTAQVVPASWDTYGDVIDIACGWGQFFIVRANGSVEGAGSENYDVLAGIASWEHVSKLSVNNTNCTALGLRVDGLVETAGYNSDGQTDLNSWDLIAGDNIGSGGAGQATSDTIETRPAAMWKDHLVAINIDGSCVGCGATTNNQIAVTGWTDIFQLATADRLTVGLKVDGTCVTTGLDWGPGATSTPPTWTDITFIACGNQSVFGIDTNGDIHACGADSGQGEVTGSTVANGFVDLVEVAAGTYHCVGLKSDGTCVGAGYDIYGLITAAESWTDIIHIESQGNVLIGVRSDGTAVYAGDDSYATKAILEALTNVARVFVDQEYEGWLAIRNDGTAINGGHPSFADTIQDWTDVEWGASAKFFSWGWSPSLDQCWSTNSDYSNVAGSCAEALTGLKDPNPEPPVVQNVSFGETVSHSFVSGIPILPVLQPVASTYTAVQGIPPPLFSDPMAAPTFIHSSSFRIPVVGFISAATTRGHIHVPGSAVSSDWVETFFQSRGLSAAEHVLTKLTASTFSHTENFRQALGFESRDVFVGSLAKCYLEDSSGNQLCALSMDIQYSGKNSTVHMVMSLPFSAGKSFMEEAVLPLSIKSNGAPVFRIEEFESSEYVGGSSKSFLVTVKNFAVVRLPGNITTPAPLKVSALAKSLSMNIPDAFDIIPGDILTAGQHPSVVVSSASIHIKDNESRSVVYG